MSYDGGLAVRIVNDQLLDILREHEAKGTFEGAEAIAGMFGSKYNGKTLAVDYEYYDCAYVDGCPKKLSSVFDYVAELLDVYGDFADNRIAFKEFMSELKSCRSLIDSGYTFVEWVYYGENGTEKFTYENGKENYNPDSDDSPSYDYEDEYEDEYDDDEIHCTYTTPDESLYPHYKNLKSASGMFGGFNVVVNSGGTEYSFISFRTALENTDDSEMSALYKRVIDKDVQNYTLHHKAAEIRKLFHVNESVFDFRHDRECEIEQGLMRRAYMMSALRSFAWTVVEYCDTNDMDIADISYEALCDYIELVAERDWLNYDGDSYCRGLCGCSDLHVFYVPDGVSESDKDMLRPGKEDYENFKQMKERFPNYNEILSDVHSLDMLRKDLELIYPAIETLYDYLKEHRDYNKELSGNDADIVYAWCALAMAAREPFFSEDGPPTCFFSQLEGSGVNDSYTSVAAPKAEVKPQAVFDDYEEEDEDAEEFCAEDWEDDGFSFISDTELYEYNGDDETVVIPYGVTAVHDDAFEFSDVESVIIPRSVTKIGNYAFQNCDSLRKIVIPDSVEDIGMSAFEHCGSLERVKLSEGITKIKVSTFEGCSSLESLIIPDGVTEIGAYAFQDCTSLETVILPDSVEVIGDSAFSGCSALRNIIIPSGVTEIGSSAFQGCSSLESISVPYGVTEIKEFSFEDCTDLESVEIPGSVTVIGKHAFQNCSSLKAAIIPYGVTEIGEFAFDRCMSLEKVTIPDTVTKIGTFAFSACSDIGTVKIPESVIEIDNLAFFETDMTAVVERGSYAENYALANRVKYTTDESFVNDDFEVEGAVFVKYNGSDCFVDIPYGITEIDDYAFQNCSDLSAVSIPSTVTKIGHSAFRDCSSLKSIILPDSVTEIDDFAFECCSELKTVILSDNLTRIGSFAFSDCYDLERIIIPESVTEIGDWAFESDITIIGEIGSYAQEYAEEKELDFIG